MKHNRVVYRLWHNRSTRGKIGYIGKDTMYPRRVNLEQRKRNVGCPKLYLALNRYPISAWKIEILASGLRTKEGLNQAERFYIRKFNSIDNGYNILKGGDGGPGWKKGRKISAETKMKLSRINSGSSHPKWGKKDSLKTRIKKSNSAKGNKGNLGKRFSASHKMKISDAQRSVWDTYTQEQKAARGRAMSRGWKRRIDAR